MKLTYDKKVNAFYLTLREGKIEKTKSLSNYLFIDEDKNGKILGVELLREVKPSKRN